jgi:hypothetical protein
MTVSSRMADHVIHISEAEAASDFAGLPSARAPVRKS